MKLLTAQMMARLFSKVIRLFLGARGVMMPLYRSMVIPSKVNTDRLIVRYELNWQKEQKNDPKTHCLDIVNV